MEIDKAVYDAMLAVCEDAARTLLLIAKFDAPPEEVDDHLDRIQRAAASAYRLAKPNDLYQPGCLSAHGVKIYDFLRESPAGLTRTEIQEKTGRRRAGNLLTADLNELKLRGLARCERVETAGRPSERWFAV